MEKRVINPEIEYYIVSLKHTHKRDKYVTLWRPDNKGYCWPLSLAGRYQGYEDGYHNHGLDEDLNIPVPCSEVTQKYLVLDDQKRECITNSKASIKFLKGFIQHPELISQKVNS